MSHAKDFVPRYIPRPQPERNEQRIFDRQLETFSARVLEHAFNEGIIAGDKVDELYLILEGLRRTQVEEMKDILY